MKPHLRITIETLLKSGTSKREIQRRTGVDRKTIRRYPALLANSPGVATGSESVAGQTPPPRPPASSASACAPHRAWIEAQITLGRNAMSLYQDLVEAHGFTCGYNSVKRFVARLKARAPERFDVLEFEAFAHDRHKHVDAHRDPYLSLDRVLGGAEEGLDAQMLLDPLEKEFHLPTAAIKLGDGQRRLSR